MAWQKSLLAIPKHYWPNDYLPALDAATLYSFTAQRKPNHYLEIGSGVSTRFVKKAITDQTLSTRIISIDPQPRADINKICDTAIRQPLEDTDLSIFRQLSQGDILFINNSHQSFQNSDVTVFFLDILPNLKRNVLVGIHDILLPDDYPPPYAHNYYNEQYLLSTYLLGGAAHIEIILPNWFVSKDPELSRITQPLFSHPNFKDIDPHGNTLWFATI